MTQFYRTARQYVVNTLRVEILQGLHPAGAHLRQEEVARRLQVSTTPVREAFRDLLAEGLVSIDPHKGVVTRGLTSGDVQEIYELRIVLEPMLAERACPRILPEHIAAAAACHDQMCATQDPDAWALLNEAFHDHFVKSEATSRLAEITASLARVARPYVVLSMHLKPAIIASNNAEHARLLAAYQDRDAQAVHANTRDHLANTRDAIVHCVDQWAAPLAAAD